jgi:hypothetical protein
MSDSKAPFSQSTQQVKTFIEHPYVKAASWLLGKSAWVLLLWAVWSLKQYGHTYVAESPAVKAHGEHLATLGAEVAKSNKAAERQAQQIAQIQTNQIEINRQLEKNNQAIEKTGALISGLQTAQAVLDVRVNNMERDLYRKRADERSN